MIVDLEFYAIMIEDRPRKYQKPNFEIFQDCIGVQFLYLRYSMTGPAGGVPYRFLTDSSELKYAKEGFRVQRRIYCCFFMRMLVIANRKMSKLFFIVLNP